MNGYCASVFLVNKKNPLVGAGANEIHDIQFLDKAVDQSVNNCCINHRRIHSELNSTKRHHYNLISYFLLLH